MPMSRLTGTVEAVREKPWSKPDGRSGTIHEITVAHLGFMRERVTLSRDLEGQFSEGDDVDLLIETTFNSGYYNVRAAAHYPVLASSKH